MGSAAVVMTSCDVYCNLCTNVRVFMLCIVLVKANDRKCHEE
jgi:hypothetical protein